MIKLDYQTNNRRWGWSGIEYSSWENYAFALGYLANIKNHRIKCSSGLIELHIEHNEEQGADAKEGRIQYYGSLSYLSTCFPDWNNCKSKGNTSITCRMNSNDYMHSLIYDFGFIEKTYTGYTTADIFPPEGDAYTSVWNRLEIYLDRCHRNVDINSVKEAYDAGWDL